MGKKSIKVLDSPATFILIDEAEDEIKAKQNWLKKWRQLNKPISQNQRNRERITIRGGKVFQRSKYK